MIFARYRNVILYGNDLTKLTEENGKLEANATVINSERGNGSVDGISEYNHSAKHLNTQIAISGANLEKVEISNFTIDRTRTSIEVETQRDRLSDELLKLGQVNK